MFGRGLVGCLPRSAMSQWAGRLAARRRPRWLVQGAIKTYAWAYRVDLGEAEKEHPTDYDAFHALFTRTLKGSVRPIADSEAHLVSPCDGKIVEQGAISTNTRLLIKGQTYRLEELLGDAEQAEAYAGGHFAVIYLSPRDYHRVHAPSTGLVRTVSRLHGDRYPVNALGLRYVPQLFARNERVAVEQQAQAGGRVLTLLVGALIVGGIELRGFNSHSDCLVLNHKQRFAANAAPMRDAGQELGFFHLGSTVVVCWSADSPWGQRRDPNTSVRLGEALASRAVAPEQRASVL